MVKYCTNCGAMIPEGSKFCVECGNQIMEEKKEDKPEPKEEKSAEPSKPKETPESSQRFCTNCGAMIPEESNFCVECGLKIGDEKPVETAKPTAPTPSVQHQAAPIIPPPPMPPSQPPTQPAYASPSKPKNLKKIGAVVVVAILIVAGFYVGFMFGKEETKKENESLSSGGNKVTITSGVFTPVTTGSVGSNGGSISVSDSSNPLNGLDIDVPTAAASETVDFSISYADVSDIKGLPDNAEVAGKLIRINTTGSTAWNKYKTFDKAIEVTLPYDSSLVSTDETVQFYAYDEETNTLSSAGMISHDETSDTITFYTRTFSTFLAIKLLLAAADLLDLDFSTDTGFRPTTDGWYITNYGSYLESGGICMGMVSYARYYYMNKKATDGTALYEKYREGDRNEWRDDDTAIELGTRAHMAESDVWDQTWRHEIATQVPTSEDVAISWIHGMLVTGSPQLIGIYQQVANGDWVGGHAILTYRFSNGRFDIYDPNYPGTAPGTDARQIPYTYANGFTRVYSSGATAGAGRFQYNVFLHWGYKAFHPMNAFDQLYTSAEDGFDDDSIFPEVKLTDSTTTPYGTTPIDIDADDIRDTTQNKVTISGTITGGQEDVTSTLIYVSNQKFKVPVINDAFSHEVPLYAGDNDVIILATHENTFSNWAGYLRDSIYSSASQASLTFTLTWGQDDSDVDLHVLEPTLEGTAGRHIYYGNKGSSWGDNPYLDIDNTWGYGPEHYYATENMTLHNYQGEGKSLYGTYKFRVHYYADHDSNYDTTQPITWHVTVRYLKFRDQLTGTEYWEENAWSGALSTASTYSTSNFNNAGASWDTIYTVEYPQPDPDDYGVTPPPQNELP